MMESIYNNNEDRGQVGIGTLIVFIALVLVAAIAAGVLINTAGFLQTQAESTGQESTDQVSNGVEVLSATGEVGAASTNTDDIQVIELRVSLRPGSDPVDLTSGTLQWVGEGATATVGISSGDTTQANGGVSGPSANTAADYFDGSSSLAEDTNAIIPAAELEELTEPGDRTSIIVTSSNAESIASMSTDSIGDLPLKTTNSAEITITTQDGGQAFVEVSVPRVVSEDEGLSL
jgi:flagellin FlaB